MKNSTLGIYGVPVVNETPEMSRRNEAGHRKERRLPVKKSRSLKVCESSGYKYRPTPTLMLKGQWLEQWGFDIDTPVTVECANGKLVIRPIPAVS